MHSPLLESARNKDRVLIQVDRRNLLQPKALIAMIAIAAPAILFYAILFDRILNIPYQDDYEALLDFLNKITLMRGYSEKASYFLGCQHNEYKLFFEHALAWLQLAIFGHTDIEYLCAFGNGFVLLLAILLWKMFLPDYKDFASRLSFFIPVPWLLFQLQYVETLNWAMASLQNLPVLVFSLGAIYLLMRATRRTFCSALVFLILAIASSGNGILMVLIGQLILARERYSVRFVSWLIVSAACVAAYAYHYNIMSSQSPIHFHNSVFASLIRLQPLYVIAFIGSAGSFPFFAGSILLGAFLCVFFVWMAWRGYTRRNPLVAYCVLFLLLTAVGVAGLRSDFGIAQGLSSRYAIYSVLLVIFAWFAIVEDFLQRKSAFPGNNLILLAAVSFAVLFSLTMDARGWFYTADHNRNLVRGIVAYEHPDSSDFPGPVLPVLNQPARADELDRRAPAILKESTKLGIYQPPKY